MQLWEEAEKISILGFEIYRFGFFIALGLAAAVAVISFLSWAKRCRRGTAPLLAVLGILLGGVFSRVGFCLMNQEMGSLMPVSSWFRITGGGWSMIGAVGGVMFAAWLTAKLTGEKGAVMRDIAACALPAFLALERAGEDSIPDFDYSRLLESTFLNGTFLTRSDYDGYYLATNRLAVIVMALLMIILLLSMIRSKREGDTCLLFLLLFGACSVMLESLRYDRFLSISFVGLQHILAAVILLIGVIAAARPNFAAHGKLASAAVISVFAAAAIAVGLEFALDRTTVNKLLIYAVYVVVIFTPAVMGIRLIHLAPERK